MKTSTWFHRILLSLAILALLTSVSFAKGNHDFIYIDPGDAWFKLTCEKVHYDPCTDCTFFCLSGKVCDDPALSYVIVELPKCAADKIVKACPENYEIGFDWKTGIYGIKWEVSVEKGQTLSGGFCLKGKWTTGDVEMGAKGGQYITVGTITGPVCSCPDGDGE